jgi:HPt (histidine-containing phosphotransfer) domain-containing protein
VGIIAMTANAMPEDRDACFAAGMDDFATKPLSLDGLAAVLRRWLGAEGPQPAAAGSVADPPAPLGVAGTLDRMADELGSPVAVRKLAQTWLGELPGRLEDLRDAARARDAERLRHGAHTLKSTSALVGAARAAELAAEAERLAAAGAEPVPVDALIAEAEIAADLVREWVSDTPADPAP